MAANANAQEVTRMNQLLAVCRLDDAQRTAFVVTGGVNSITKMAVMKEKQVDTLVKNLSGLSVARGSAFIGYQACNLAALAWWLRDHIRRDRDIDPADFDQEALDSALVQMENEKKEDESDALAPGKIKTGRGWPQWELSFENYLRSIRGKAGVPLLYIIRKGVEPGFQPESHTDALIYQAPHDGLVYDTDNQQVFALIKMFALETQAWEWIRTLDSRQDGRLAMQTLREHYDGPGEVQKRLALARQQIRDLHYRSEQTFTFESFATKLKGAFEVLEECQQPVTENEKVSILASKIEVNNTRVQSAITIATTTPFIKDNFDAACNMISEVVSMVFPDVRAGRQGASRRNVSPANRGGGGSGRGGRGGGGRGGRGHAGGRGGGGGGAGGGRGNSYGANNRTPPIAHHDIPKQSNGVDLSDVRRQMSPAEWAKLDKQLQQKIREHRAYLNASANHKRKVGAVETDHTENGDEHDQHDTERPSKQANTANPRFGRSSYRTNDA